MARKAPSQVRSDLPRRTPREGDRAVVPGVSSRTLVEIARVERHQYEPGAAYRALSAWRATVYGRGPSWIIYPSWDDDYPCCRPVWGGDHRETLEVFCRSLSRRAVRELRAVLAPLDARFLARTLPDPYAPPGDPWWRRRLERA
ncbi:hypothetical protein M8Z33_16400 [Streptomyces sp. ZAF1911]|uniref:hypothetical protein n=1 Tax=Streptomyces sp. ZAF1911 TaxID=2944129 RepID=UPI00237A8A6E|nr:hypothetical protein [Streptomyces sp. ZAF1911]MDD9378209.1 hypothetical protein [Streptomyces sp. ZAF1911]